VKAFPLDHGFDGLYGLEVLEMGEDRARARVRVVDELKLSHGFVHGGVYAAIAESLASTATGTELAGEDRIAVALANHTSVLHPVSAGTIEALAVRRHRGRTTWVWQVDMSDSEDRLCVVARVTIAIRAADDHRGAPRPSQ
jgi:uncharacterized protein (TIGR00369 family)